MKRVTLFVGIGLLLWHQALAQNVPGVQVNYELPSSGALPQTYLVTLAIVQKDNPRWILSQFVRGEPRTVTVENKGHFSDAWDGLDENLMPLPPGSYAVKGIYMPAQQWKVDGEYHAVVPQFAAGASSWMPSREQWSVPDPFGGDPCGAPLGDVDVGANGVGVFYYTYLENGLNTPMMDLNKPLGLGQFLRAFNSGGAGGGTSTCTDGETVWSFSTDGGAKYVYRADGKPFGKDTTLRSNVFIPEGWVKALACWKDAASGKAFVYVAQGGRIEPYPTQPNAFFESASNVVDVITIHAGAGGQLLARQPLSRPLGIAVRGGALYALHGIENGYAVESLTLQAGLPQGAWQRLFALPASREPADLEVDSRGRIYISFPAANKVAVYDRAGKPLSSIGRLDEQRSGHYDPLTLMSPGKLAIRTDTEGNDRVLVVEDAGPNRVSEWSPEGKLLLEYASLQTKANDGYAIDPDNPDTVYIAGQKGWMARFKVDVKAGTWKVDAVFPHVGDDPKAPGLDHPFFIKHKGRSYLACGREPYSVYRQEGDRWLLSTALIPETENNKRKIYGWRDLNGDGKVQEKEYRSAPLEMPGQLFHYHGSQWQEDFSLLALNMGGQDVWQLSPSGFDPLGNPIFTGWKKVLSDPVFALRQSGKAHALNGGNELDDAYSSDWCSAAGAIGEPIYVVARGGKSFSANEGAQVKLSRFEPDGKGGYDLLWRVGRTALQGLARRGEIYGAIHMRKPINGLISVVDQSRCGILLYTEDGLYVDTLFPDGRKFSRDTAGVYPLPGEFFAGHVYANKDDGRIYIAVGKFTPMLFEAQGWSLRENPVRPLKTLPKTVTIAAPQIAAPPEIALTLRGGAGTARVARFSPALGGAVLDGSMTGWESCSPLVFRADKEQSVEVRGLYDPGHLYLRWHARLAGTFTPKPLHPADRIFAHDRLSDTLSLYIQGDPNAKPGGSADGRPGDVRMIFGLFEDGGLVKPVALGLYPTWSGTGKASPTTYRTPVNTVKFAHVGFVEGVELHHTLDADGKGFVIAAAIPRQAIPGLPALGAEVRSMVNFEATFAGHNKFWWSNADGSANRETYDEPTEARLYPGSWSQAQFQGLKDGVLVRNWQLCGPFGGPGAEKFIEDPNGKFPGTERDFKSVVSEYFEAAAYPPDSNAVDLAAGFTGDQVLGYWKNPGTVRWTPAAVADLDTRVICGPGAQVWYGATWVYAPEALPIDFLFQGHWMTPLRWFLNGEKVQEGVIPEKDGRMVCLKSLTLRKGWNQILFRGYCFGYPPFRVGLVLSGEQQNLWKLRLSATPPAQGQTGN